MASVLVLAPSRSLRFVEDDVRVLAGAHDVDVLERETYRSRRRLLPELLRRLVTHRPALLYVWFADPYDTPWALLLARAFGVRSVVVAGGYDVTWMPALDYGALQTRGSRRQLQIALRLADVVLPTSEFIATEVRRLGATRSLRVVHLGVDCERFSPGGAREPLVVTVGAADAESWRLKGLDVFAACSKLLPELRFVILGRRADAAVAAQLRALGGPNLTLVDRELATPELIGWYRRASVYAQLSARESFGLALAEGMACGCAPVVADVGSLPEVVGDARALVAYGDVAGAARAIADAVARGDGARARQRVRERFTQSARAAAVLETVSGLLGAAPAPEVVRAAG